jgi:microsomal epoxide hydrolase
MDADCFLLTELQNPRLNMPYAAQHPPEDLAKEMPTYSDQERSWIEKFKPFWEVEDGYQRIQQSKPQTLRHGLSDSPVGLMAWIVEKFHSWTDLRGQKDLPPTISKDELLTNVQIYWITWVDGAGL